MRVDWDEIDTVLLDMDGTLIDQHHEDVFWERLVPRAYAAKHNLSLKESRRALFAKYKAKEGTPYWGDVFAWERDLQLGLPALRRKADKFIKLHPHTVRFLKFLQRRGKKIYLVTATPQPEVAIKLSVTGIKNYFEGIITQTQIGKSKNDVDFWKILHKKLKFDKNRTLFADDNEKMLEAAEEFGIKQLVFKGKSSSRKPCRKHDRFICVRHFDDIISSRKSRPRRAIRAARRT